MDASRSLHGFPRTPRTLNAIGAHISWHTMLLLLVLDGVCDRKYPSETVAPSEDG